MIKNVVQVLAEYSAPELIITKYSDLDVLTASVDNDTMWDDENWGVENE